MLDLNGQTQYYLGLYEWEVRCWTQRFLKKSKIFIDIGSGEGYYALFALKQPHLHKILAFEPLEESRKLLNENLGLNAMKQDARLEISERFVGKNDPPLYRSLDSLLISESCTIKMDVEGAELEILREARRFMNGGERFWIIETHSARLEDQCAQVLGQAGYRIRIIPNAWWRCLIPEGRPIAHNRWLVAFR